MSTVEQLLSRVLEELRNLGSRLNSRGELPSVLTLKMAARELSCSVSKVRELIRRGELMTVAVGGRRMVPRAEIERFASAMDAPTQEQEAATALSIAHRRHGKTHDFKAEAERARALTKKRR